MDVLRRGYREDSAGCSDRPLACVAARLDVGFRGVVGSGLNETSDGTNDEQEFVMQEEARFAGLWPRFLALLVDLLLFSAFFFPITRLTKGVWLMSAADHRWGYGMFITDPLCIAFLIVMVLYFVLLEGLTGMTLGKRVAGLRVERVGGGKPGLIKGLVRNVLRVVDALPVFNILGIVLISTSAERARFGDRIAGTRVIQVRGRPSPS